MFSTTQKQLLVAKIYLLKRKVALPKVTYNQSSTARTYWIRNRQAATSVLKSKERKILLEQQGDGQLLTSIRLSNPWVKLD